MEEDLLQRKLRENDPVIRLQEKLEKEIRKAGFFGGVDHVIGLMAMLLAICGSFVATIMGFMGSSAKLVGIIAAIPGFTAILATRLRFEARAHWHNRLKYSLDKVNMRLLLAMKMRDVSGIKKALNDWTQVNGDMIDEWYEKFEFDWNSVFGKGEAVRSGARKGVDSATHQSSEP
jgi:hypothetical protein